MLQHDSNKTESLYFFRHWLPKREGTRLRGGSKRSTGLLFMLLLELEAVLKSCSLVVYEVLRCRVRILEEVSHALELNCDA